MAQARADKAGDHPSDADARRARLILSLRAGGVTDPQVLAALEKTPRDLFTPDLFKDRAWEDSALPIACGQTISQPLIVGMMTQALTLEPPRAGAGDRHRLRLPDRGCSRSCRDWSTAWSAIGRCCAKRRRG